MFRNRIPQRRLFQLLIKLNSTTTSITTDQKEGAEGEIETLSYEDELEQSLKITKLSNHDRMDNIL